jgi:hypothetical protein
MSESGIHTVVNMLYPERYAEKDDDNECSGGVAACSEDAIKKRFGVLNMKIDDTAPIVKKLSWIITVDRSASMNEQCEDGKVKMDHIKHTLLNMLDYFVQFKDIEQTLTLIIFDHEVEILLSQVKICEELLDSFSDLLAKTKPRGQTNIEAALQTAALIPDCEGDRLVHIFMTDGRITSGKTRLEDIKKALVYEKNGRPFSNVFVGYGCDHDAMLLRELGSVSGGDYYFVESLENAGFVYGEIVYNYFYAYIENVVVSVEGGLIYDYVENKWKDALCIDSLPSGKERVWHLLTFADADDVPFRVSCQFNKLNGSSTFSVYPKISYPSQGALSGALSGPVVDGDIWVEKYYWRQLTQELLAETKEFIHKREKRAAAALVGGRGHGRDGAGRNIHRSFANSSVLQPHYLNVDKYAAITSIIDCAIHKNWALVEPYLDIHPDMVDKFSGHNYSPNYKFNLLQTAVRIGDLDGVKFMLRYGANPSLPNKDGLTPIEIAKNNSNIEICFVLQEGINSYKSLKGVDSVEKYNKKLNEFLVSMKKFMTQHNLGEDEFMKNLCDDITICIFGLSSSLGDMYITARTRSQGKQGAYNVSDMTPLQRSQSVPVNMDLLQRGPSSVYSGEAENVLLRTMSQTRY